MIWWQTLIVSLATLVVAKLLELFVDIAKEKRKFIKQRREIVLNDIEQLKSRVGIIYELAANWKGFDQKKEAYASAFTVEHELIGAMNKYPKIAQATRDVIHWCELVASEEYRRVGDVHELKKELGEKYRAFINECDSYLSSLV